MAKRDRQLERLRLSPKNVRPDELRTILERYGFELRSICGSYWIYKHPALARRLAIPFRRPLKPIYVAISIQAIDEVMDNEDGS